eukprot:scaffold44333_cov59-Phaeocystis_antarctica.AAC.4
MARERRACTQNMKFMFVTLDVSTLSGWSNANVYCRESKGGHTVRGELWAGRREMAGDRGREAMDDRSARSVCGGGLECRSGAGHGEERTKNM